MDKTTVAAKKLYTLAEFERIAALPENEDRLLELIHREIVEKVPTPSHSVLAAWIAAFLNIYVIEHDDQGLVSVEGRHRAGDDSSLLPDASYFRDRDVAPTESSFDTVPDLAIEVKSPRDSYKAMRAKAALYLERGTQIVWLVYPEKLKIEVHRQGVEAQTLGIEDTLDGGDLLPGFTLPVHRVFRKIAH